MKIEIQKTTQCAICTHNNKTITAVKSTNKIPVHFFLK